MSPGKKKPLGYEPSIKVNLTPEKLEELIKEGEKNRLELEEKLRKIIKFTAEDWQRRSI